MGAEPYYYFVPYEADIEAALQKLRRREFEAGRYNPAMPFLTFPIEEGSPAPGAQHDSIAEALEDADADGTRSILDIQCTAEWPEIGVAGPMTERRLQELFGSARPTRAMLENNYDLFEDLDRGQCVYVIVYQDDAPAELYFAGYSFD